MSSLVFALALILTSVADTTRAQDDPPFPVYSEEVSVQWISVPTVLGPSWPADATPEQGLFELRVDGAPVLIEGFDDWDAPLGLVFLQDLSGSMALGSKLELGRLVLEALSALADVQDTMAVVTFTGGRVQLQIPFTSDEAALRAAPSSWSGYGTTAIRDALAALPAIARSADHPRRAVVLVTDGIDNASAVTAGEVRALLAGEGLPLYVIDVDTDSAVRPSLEDGNDEGFDLAELAAASGGRRLRVSSPLQAQSAVHAIASDLRRQLLLSFTADTSGASALRRIEVTLRGETSGLVHRSRYYGPPPGHVLPSPRKEKP